MSNQFESKWRIRGLPRPNEDDMEKLIDEALSGVGLTRTTPITMTEFKDNNLRLEMLAKMMQPYASTITLIITNNGEETREDER